MLLQAVLNWLIPDHKADAFDPPVSDACAVQQSSCDSILHFLFDGYRKWDARHFVHIAEHGYQVQNALAFFPLFPALSGLLARTLLWPLSQSCTCFTNVVLLSGFLVTTVSHVDAARSTFHLVLALGNGRREARIAALLFLLNPAFIFFQSNYTEALFSALLFRGILSISRKRVGLATFWFALCTLTRSNGTLAVLYFGLPFLCAVQFTQRFVLLVKAIPVALAYVAYQLFTYMLCCTEKAKGLFEEPDTRLKEYYSSNGYDLIAAENRAETFAWCNYSLPFSYNYVQERYWNVGLFRYYQLKQLPNFFLAAPILLLSVQTVRHYCTTSIAAYVTAYRAERSAVSHAKRALQTLQRTARRAEFALCVPMTLHLAFLSVVCALFVHIQVSTRMLCSSSPLLYAYLASRLPPAAVNEEALLRTMQSRWCVFFVAYALLGTILHTNFFPWT